MFFLSDFTEETSLQNPDETTDSKIKVGRKSPGSLKEGLSCRFSTSIPPQSITFFPLFCGLLENNNSCILAPLLWIQIALYISLFLMHSSYFTYIYKILDSCFWLCLPYLFSYATTSPSQQTQTSKKPQMPNSTICRLQQDVWSLSGGEAVFRA